MTSATRNAQSLARSESVPNQTLQRTRLRRAAELSVSIEEGEPEMPGELVRLLPVLQKRGRLTNADVRHMLGVARNTAARLLTEFAAASWLVHSGKRGLGAFCVPGSRLLHQSQTGQQASETGAMKSETGAIKP